MKKILSPPRPRASGILPVLLALLTFALPSGAQTTNILLGWDHSTSTGIVGYKIYQGNAPDVYDTNFLVVYTNRAVVRNLSFGVPYYFVCTAINDAAVESPPSNEVSWRVNPPSIPPEPPLNLQILGDVPPDPEPGLCDFLMDRNTAAQNGSTILFVGAVRYAASPFRSDIPYHACEAHLYLGRVGVISGLVQAQIWTEATPSVLIGESQALGMSVIPTNGTENEIAFSFATPIALQAGVLYRIAIKASDVSNNNSSSYVRWYRNATGDGSLGVLLSNDGQAWSVNTASRAGRFKILSQEIQ